MKSVSSLTRPLSFSTTHSQFSYIKMASLNTHLTFIALAALVTGSWALLEWRTLISTFGVPIEPSRRHYVTLPRTQSDAESEGWRSISFGDCTNGGRYNGHRYIKEDDWSLALLFDKNGYIAGIQANPLRSDLLGTKLKYPYSYGEDPGYLPDIIDGHEVFTATTYFVYPGTICSHGRDSAEWWLQGTGTQLYFQNGPTPCHVTSPAPRERERAYSQKWSKNMCFVGMGLHNYYDIDSVRNNNCSYVRPQFLLYSHENELHGFGFDFVGYATSPNDRFEHPGRPQLYAGVGPSIPDCMLDNVISTLHVWFVEEPWKFRCP